MTTQRWAAIRVAVDDEPANPGGGGPAAAAAGVLLSAGSAGTANDVGALDEVVAVVGYLPEDERLGARLRQIDAALALLPAIGVAGVASAATVAMIDEEDWASAWKRYFKPLRVGRHLIVTPPWETPERRDGDHLLVIDPGMAFGTGTHSTTRLCLAALEEYVPGGDIDAPGRPARRVADIGTGSGILAIAAKKLGAGYVFAADTDPLAVRIARENAAVNGVVIDARAADAERVAPAPEYDLLVANILADTLIGLADEFAAAVRPGGVYIASGIIDGREDDVRFYTEGAGFTALGTRREGDWVALVFRRGQA